MHFMHEYGFLLFIVGTFLFVGIVIISDTAIQQESK